jgi:hypothetical protein
MQTIKAVTLPSCLYAWPGKSGGTWPKTAAKVAILWSELVSLSTSGSLRRRDAATMQHPPHLSPHHRISCLRGRSSSEWNPRPPSSHPRVGTMLPMSATFSGRRKPRPRHSDLRICMHYQQLPVSLDLPSAMPLSACLISTSRSTELSFFDLGVLLT